MSAAEQIEQVIEYRVDQILDSTIPNYRVTLSDMDELTASVTESGVVVPLVLRPSPVVAGGHELVLGERRRAAAKRAGLVTVPVIIRDYDDDQVLEARAIENIQRKNVDPIEEAEGFQVLVARGYSYTRIAEKIGLRGRDVAERLRLTGLSQACRKALADDKISVGVAILLAKLPTSKIQDEALKSVSPQYDGDAPMTVAQAKLEIEEDVMLALKNAPFKLDDAALDPKAGSCVACPKRTGTQQELFADASSPDLCTDPPCYRGKLDALWKVRVKKAKDEGIEVLSKADGAKALQRLHYGDSPFTKLDDTVRVGNKSKTVKALFGKELPPVTLARDERTGLHIELVPSSAVERAIKAAVPTTKNNPERPNLDSRTKNEREAEKLQAEVRRRTMTELVDRFDEQVRQGKGALSKRMLQLLVQAILGSAWSEVCKRTADRRGLPMVDEGAGSAKKGAKRQLPRLTTEERFERVLFGLDQGQLAGLLLELVMGRAAPGKWSEASDCYIDCCAELGVDPKAIEAAVKAEKKTKGGAAPATAKAEPSKPKKTKPKPAKAKKNKAPKTAPPEPEDEAADG